MSRRPGGDGDGSSMLLGTATLALGVFQTGKVASGEQGCPSTQVTKPPAPCICPLSPGIVATVQIL